MINRFVQASLLAFSAGLVGYACSQEADTSVVTPVETPVDQFVPESSVQRMPTPYSVTASEPNQPWSVALPQELNHTADYYEQLLQSDPLYADPASPQARALRHRMILNRIFSNALSDFNDRTMGPQKICR
jgi:hypothetical protein